jgi:hypothetical protein
VQHGLTQAPIWDALKGQIFLRSEAFFETMQKRVATEAINKNAEIPREQRKALVQSLDFYRDAFDDAESGMLAAYATVSRALRMGSSPGLR